MCFMHEQLQLYLRMAFDPLASLHPRQGSDGLDRQRAVGVHQCPLSPLELSGKFPVSR